VCFCVCERESVCVRERERERERVIVNLSPKMMQSCSYKSLGARV